MVLKMGIIAIRISDELEAELRHIALAKGKKYQHIAGKLSHKISRMKHFGWIGERILNHD